MRKWTDARLNPRSGYYAGRGPSTSDLNERHLEALWQGIHDDVGEWAAQNFVFMVTALEDMSATAFLVSFESYFYAKFRWADRQQKPGDAYVLSGRGDALIAEATCTVFAALGRGNVNPEADKWASRQIKEGWLRRHGVNLPPPKGAKMGYGRGSHFMFADHYGE